MYKNYITTSLPLNDYLKKNKEAPNGERFCNGLCAKYLPINNFFEGKGNCKDCYYLFLKVKKMVDNNQLTYEKFQKDPSVVQVEKTIIDIKRKCITCEEEKTLEQFEDTRKECIKCRKNKKKINYQKQFEEILPTIEKTKDDINALTHLFRSMSADLIKLAISHYKITVPYNERKKDLMIVKLIDHFQSLLNPKICLGGCGFELENEFSVCKACKDKPKNLREQKKVDFEENIDLYVEQLEDFTDEDASKLTKDKCVLIAKKLNIKFYISNKKYTIVEKIKQYFEDKKKKDLLIKNDIKNLTGYIVLNGITIESRKDGMINATQMCKAGGKRFNNWYRLDTTKELIDELEKQLSITETHLRVSVIDIIKGGNDLSLQGSWIHPDLAVQLAQWISPVFAIQISRWTRELLLTGSVNLFNEKTHVQLLELEKEKKKIETKYRQILQKKTYHKFKTGPAFYIISDIDSKSIRFKPGFDGVDINNRLQQHRSSMPGCKLEFLIYSENANLVETIVLTCFDEKRYIHNKEWLFDVDIQTIIRQTRAMLNVTNIKYTEEEDLRIYNEEILEDFTQVNLEEEK